jgi:hypothetical protein
MRQIHNIKIVPFSGHISHYVLQTFSCEFSVGKLFALFPHHVSNMITCLKNRETITGLSLEHSVLTQTLI